MNTFRRQSTALTGLIFVLLVATAHGANPANSTRALSNPILFVTQMPITADFTTIGSTFGNQRADMASVGRGGDLYSRYADGNLRNLTAEAGFGQSGLQSGSAIAVRDPAVHFSGTKAIFSMVIGAPQQFVYNDYYWQLYEITGFGAGQTVSISKVPNQPQDYNNIQAIYSSDGQIIFVSDRPRNGQRHLYPQHDEYESAATPTGLWKLNPSTGVLSLLEHSPSGSFDPTLDRFGRVVFSRWDHLQRDQQADIVGNPNASFNWVSEAANAAIVPLSEVFPEPRVALAGSNVNGHRLNQFFPWTINQDGTGEEMLNHIGRHEMQSYFDRSFNDDDNLVEFNPGTRPNQNSLENMMYIHEDSNVAGRFVGIDLLEFGTHGSGQIVAITGAPSINPDQMLVSYLTPRITRGTEPGAGHSGHYRNPIIMSNGDLVVSHAAEQTEAGNLGSATNPNPKYKFRLQRMALNGGVYIPAEALTTGISKTISYYDPDNLISYNANLWELSPVEVKVTSVPPAPGSAISSPELAAFTAENVSPAAFAADLRNRNLGVIVIRDATTRDRADKQQPYNLRVPGGRQTIGSAGRIYDIAHFQLFQGDQVRGIYQSQQAPQGRAGRRVLAQVMHEPALGDLNVPNPGGPAGSVAIASDGSIAAFVPAQRALSWQSTAPNGTPVVRERFWLTLQPGEIRTCDGCHGINTANQAGAAASNQTPQALRTLLARWKTFNNGDFRDGFE